MAATTALKSVPSQPGAAARFLGGLRAFRNLSERESEEVARIGWSLRAPRGQVLYCEGELLRQLFIVGSGSVKLIRNSDEGKELIVGLVAPGECFGAMIYPQHAASLAQALEDSVIFQIPIQGLRRIAESNAPFVLDLLEITEQQSIAAQSTAARFAFESVPRRLAQLLVDLADERHGGLKFPLNQTEIANLIGSSRETVCSNLGRLRREGLLSIVKGRIRVLQRELLRKVR